ncbi:MAG: O-antigen ligase family protein [Acidobacteriota bacterium]
MGALALTLFYAVLRDGGVEPKDWGACLIAVGALSAAWWAARRRNPLSLPHARVGLLLPILMGVGALQVIPLPAAVVGIVSPARGELLTGAEPVMGGWRLATLSAAPAASLEKLVSLAGYVLVVLLVLDISSRLADYPWAPVLPLLAIAVFEAVLGLVQAYSASGGGIAHGTYVNRNHYSGLLEMCLPFAVMYGAAVLRRNRSRHRTPAGPALRASAAWALAAVILLAIIHSLSRMGFIAALASSFLMGLAALRAGKRSRWRAWLPAAVLGAVVVLGFIFLPPDQLILRFGDIASTDEISADTRLKVWGDTTRLISAYPLVGCGLGAYESCLKRYKTAALLNTVDFAHNDYLQLAAELGLPGLCLVLAVGAGLLASAWRTADRSAGADERYRSLACIGALAAISLHSFVDFNLYIPANAMTLAWIGGLAQSRAEVY